MSSATGGYLPSTLTPLPGGLTLAQFIQTVIVGISGYPASSVRPSYQVEPPKQPDVLVDWIAFNIQIIAQDANAYVGMNEFDVTQLSRQEAINVVCSFYGPNSGDNVSAFVDGFQVTQNLEALTAADMGFTACGFPTRAPELVNERWVDRYDVTVTLARKVVRTYQILPFASAQGTIHTVTEGAEYNSNFTVEPS